MRRADRGSHKDVLTACWDGSRQHATAVSFGDARPRAKHERAAGVGQDNAMMWASTYGHRIKARLRRGEFFRHGKSRHRGVASIGFGGDGWLVAIKEVFTTRLPDGPESRGGRIMKRRVR